MSTIEKQKRKKSRAKSIVRAIMVIIGGIIAAYGLETVLIPNSVSDGGVTGLSIVGSQLFHLPLGILIAAINIPFVWLGYKQIGKNFAFLSIIGIASLAAGTVFFHHTPAIIEGDTLLITVVGGIILGLGMGLALRNGGALDGIDMLAAAVTEIAIRHERPHFIFKHFCVYFRFICVRAARRFAFRHCLLHCV